MEWARFLVLGVVVLVLGSARFVLELIDGDQGETRDDSQSGRPTFQDSRLQHEIMQLRRVNNSTKLLYLAMDMSSLAMVVAMAVSFGEYRRSLGIPWIWSLPVFGIAIILIGGIQHRLAGLGHEASHYCFMKNRFLNDFIPDVFCMFPLMTTVHFYRLFHIARTISTPMIRNAIRISRTWVMASGSTNSR